MGRSSPDIIIILSLSVLQFIPPPAPSSSRCASRICGQDAHGGNKPYGCGTARPDRRSTADAHPLTRAAVGDNAHQGVWRRAHGGRLRPVREEPRSSAVAIGYADGAYGWGLGGARRLVGGKGALVP